MDEEISVLITFYNSEKYVDKAIESVINQIVTVPYKIIIGDDGSEDGTIDKVIKWEERFPDKIFHIVQSREKNKRYIAGSRASKNRLALLKLVDTPYFIYLDGDDYWTNNKKLQIQYDILQNPKNKDCVGCGHIIKVYNENTPDNITTIPNFLNKEKKYTARKYWSDYYFHTDTILFRSKYIKLLDLSLLEDFFNDNLITFSFLQFGKIYFVPIEMAAYRQNNQGLWAAEKQYVNTFRNLQSFDIEQKINSNLLRESLLRHSDDFLSYQKNHVKFSSLDEEYKKISIDYKCNYSMKAIDNKPLMSNNWVVEIIKIRILFIRHKLLSLKKFISKQ